MLRKREDNKEAIIQLGIASEVTHGPDLIGVLDSPFVGHFDDTAVVSMGVASAETHGEEPITPFPDMPEVAYQWLDDGRA